MKRTYFKKTQKLFANIGEEKASGLSFSVMVVAQYVLTLLFLILARLFGVLKEGYDRTQWYLYCSYLLPQAAFALTAYMFFTRTPVRVKSVVSRPKGKYFLVAIAMQFGLLSLTFLNEWFIRLMQSFGFAPQSPSVPSLNGARIVLAIFVLGVIPAIFEETFFRGILLSGTKKFGTLGAVLCNAALFSLYHQSPSQTLYQFICGACFALIALRSGSILPTVISHFLNNAVVLILTACGIESFPLPCTIVFAVLFVASLSYLFFFDKDGAKGGVKKSEVEGGEMQTVRTERTHADVKGFLLCALTGIIVCALTWVSVLLSGTIA